MADAQELNVQGLANEDEQPWRLSVEQARESAKARFRDRVNSGEKVGGCSCHDEEAADSPGDATDVVGVRFRDSGRIYFFQSGGANITSGMSVVVTTSRGDEVGRIIVAPRQMLMSQLDGNLTPIKRVLTDDDITQIDSFRKESSRIMKRAGELSRGRDLRIKAVAADFSLDGSRLKLSYSAPDDANIALLQEMLEEEVNCEISMVQVGPREEARLLGGLGKCGRTLCCASWLPVYPDVNMGMVKNQELSLNPTKVSGMCGRLLCCLSYENEQYKQAKAIMPRLGQRVVTDEGEGMVVSLRILKELVTVRYTDPHREQTYPASEILTGAARRAREETRAAEQAASVADDAEAQSDMLHEDGISKRRRRRRGRRPGSNPSPAEGN